MQHPDDGSERILASPPYRCRSPQAGARRNERRTPSRQSDHGAAGRLRSRSGPLLTDAEAANVWRSRDYSRTTVRLLRVSHPLVRLPFGLPLAAARDRLDVLLAHVHRPPASPCPVVTLINDVSFARMPQYFSHLERTYMNRTIPVSMRRSQALVAISEFTRDEVVRVYDIPRERIAVAQCAADPMFFDSTPRRSSITPPFFLSIGNLQPRKNLVTLVRAYRQLSGATPISPRATRDCGKGAVRGGASAPRG